jgi:hypothetical protein
MDKREPEAEPHFSQPVRQITSMLIALTLVGAIGYFGFNTIRSIFLSNPYLNGLILAVFVLGVMSCFAQVVQLRLSVHWIEGFARESGASNLSQAPSLLAPLATLLRSRGARMQLSSSSSRSILDSVAQRIDEDREITRYLGNTLIFLGLLGTFYGLATTVPALVKTIQALSPEQGESGADIFGRLQTGLESQLGGMGTAFSSSLLGLAGSLVVGLLELFAGHGQNRFYRELEEWMSTITRLGFASGDEGTSGDQNVMAGVIDHLAEQMEALQMMFTQSDISRSHVDERLGNVAQAIGELAARMDADETAPALQRLAEGQDRLNETLRDRSADAAGPALQRLADGQDKVIAALRDRKDDATPALLRVAAGQERLLEKLGEDGADGMDAESRMRLRSIDVQLLRILEEMAAGRQETMADLRSDIAGLTRALRQSQGGRGRPGTGG